MRTTETGLKLTNKTKIKIIAYYECLQTFRSTRGKPYVSGETISEGEFFWLDYSDRINFLKVEVPVQKDYSTPSDTRRSDDYLQNSLYTTLASSFGTSNDSFGGYSGGDSGGAGASGDW